MQKEKEGIKTVGRSLADWMQRQSERLSRRSKITLWFLFCLAAGGISGWFIVGGITGRGGSVFSITSIKMPGHVTEGRAAINPSISVAEYEKIHRFRMYMDSLARSPSGKHRYDSLMKERPGLLDSLQAVERLYGSQHK